MKFALRNTAMAGAALAAGIVSTPASALNIILRADSSFTSQANGSAALTAFQKAANYWNTILTDDVTINFNVSYRALAANVIAQAGSAKTDVLMTDVYSGLAAKSVTALDQIAVANLRPLSAKGGLGYRMPNSIPAGQTTTHFGLDTTAASIFDNDDTANNRVSYTNTANLRVLGISEDVYGNDLNDPSLIDASITFSSAFNFDFDPTDGIDQGTQDFVSVAIHEMGHALGFTSGTDLYDFYGGNPAANGVRGPGYADGLLIDWDSLSGTAVAVWDLFRYSTNGPANSGFDPATGKRYLQLDPNRGAAFSIDGKTFFNQMNAGQAEFANLSTGRYNGDGQQASHWKDENGFTDENGCFVSNRQIGVMDPTSGTCQPGIVTANDVAAFDAMGYTLNFDVLQNKGYVFTSAQAFELSGFAAVPEPATWAMMIGGFGLIGAAARRRARMNVTFA